MRDILKNRTSLNMEGDKASWIKGPLDEKFMSRGKFLLAYEEIKKEIFELEQKYRPLTYSELDDFYYSEDFSPENGKYEEVINDVKNLRKKYELNPSFDRNIFYFILHGNPLTWSDPEGLAVYAREHWFPYRFNKTGEEIMVIPVYAETTIRDIQKFWPLITKAKRQFYNHRSGRVIPRKNLERDIEIFTMKQQGMKNRDLLNKIRELYPKAGITYPDISRIIKRLKSMP